MSKFLVMVFACVSVLAQAQMEPKLNARQSVMLETLNHVRDLYLQHYAPIAWKEEQRPNLFLNKYQEVVQAIQNEPNMTKSRFRDLLHGFVTSTRDYHVNITFYSTESSVLPMSVRSAEKRVFVAYVKPTKDPAYSGISVGDEILEWNGRPAFDVLKDLMRETVENESATDRRIAEFHYTFRTEMERIPARKGTFPVKFRKPDGTEYSRALTWDYTPEEIPVETPIVQSFLHQTAFYTKSNSVQPLYIADSDLVAMMDLRETLLGLPGMDFSADQTKTEGTKAKASDSDDKKKKDDPVDPDELGQRKSVVPDLGKVIWENDESNPFRSYIYLNSQGKLIGYLRIPSYAYCDKTAMAHFDDNIKQLEDKTDALVLDEISNPGGILQFAYAVLSRFAQNPISVMPQRMAISEADGFDAYRSLLQDAKMSQNDIDNNDTDICGYHTGASEIYGDKKYDQFVLNQLKEGKTLTDPVYMDGLHLINQNEKAHYDKPVLMLIDSFDFSGADFTPAMLQDAGRVKTFGTRTSGAGGIIKEFKFPNQFGIASISMTISQAIRKNGQPLENLGVEPDIPYSFTADDLQHGYRDYKDAINKAVDGLLTDKGQSKP